VALDWLVYWMTQPPGLMAIGLAVVIPVFFWWSLLGNAFARVGFTPLAVAYACAALGLLIVTFTTSYSEFSHRVSSGGLQESQRWSIVPGWTIAVAIIYLVCVLPLLGIVGVPLTALLLRLRKLTYASIAVTAVTLWLALAFLGWAFPINEWQRTHRLASFTMYLMDLLPSIALIAVPFLLGIHVASRSARREET
jgi:hypothetical protein